MPPRRFLPPTFSNGSTTRADPLAAGWETFTTVCPVSIKSIGVFLSNIVAILSGTVSATNSFILSPATCFWNQKFSKIICKFGGVTYMGEQLLHFRLTLGLKLNGWLTLLISAVWFGETACSKQMHQCLFF